MTITATKNTKYYLKYCHKLCLTLICWTFFLRAFFFTRQTPGMLRSGSVVLLTLSSAAERLKDPTHREEEVPPVRSALRITSGVWSLSNPKRVSLRVGDEADWGLGLSNDRSPMLRRLYERRTLLDQTGSCSGCFPGLGEGDAEGWMGDKIVGLGAVVSAWGGLEILDLFADSPETLFFSTFSLLGSDAACE